METKKKKKSNKMNTSQRANKNCTMRGKKLIFLSVAMICKINKTTKDYTYRLPAKSATGGERS